MLLEQQDFWSFFNPDVEIYMPPDDGDLSVKPKGKRAHHHGRIHPTEFLGFWIFLDYFFRVWGPTPPGLGVAYPYVVPTCPDHDMKYHLSPTT